MSAESPPSNLNALVVTAQRLANQKNWDEARRSYLEILARDPQQPQALEGLALVALQTNDPKSAVTLLERNAPTVASNGRLLGLLGIAYKRDGNLSDAIRCYRKSLAIAPKDHATTANLARALRESGQLGQAISEFQRAADLAPHDADTLSMLSNAAREYAQLDLALKSADRALHENHRHAEAHLNRGAALQLLGDLAAAVVAYYLASRLAPNHPNAKANLERALASIPAAPQAAMRNILELIQGLRKDPNSVELLGRLGELELAKGNTANALVCLELCLRLSQTPEMLTQAARLLFERKSRKQAKEYASHALAIAPDYLPAHRLLGLIWSTEQEPEQAEKHWRQVVAEKPLEASAWVNLGVTLTRQGRPVEATKLLEHALRLNPKVVEGYINLGAALSDQGRFAEARAAYARGLELAPNRTELYSNLLFSMHFDPSISRNEIYLEHRKLGAKIEWLEKPLLSPLHVNRERERPLRIGFVSPDLREHPVAYLLEPFLREHDRDRYQIRCYSDVRRPDAVTARLSSEVQALIDTTSLTDDALAMLIASDKIDILVDLAGHTAHNRLRVFAKKPSPIAASWLGYFNTTGLERIDYRLADEPSVPSGTECLFVERIMRLPRTANCYLPPRHVPISPAPCIERGYITFGCFNNPAKITRQVAATFANILRAVCGSKLILKYGAFSDPEIKNRFLTWFDDEGIDRTRIELLGHSSLTDFFRAFADIDIALDPFPYSGETTAFHTLWMGVPLVALEGDTLVQRLGTRVLHIAGFGSWVAQSRKEYERIAIALAAQPQEIVARHRIRETLQTSAFFDYIGVTREIETAFRAMWHDYIDRTT